MKVLIITPHLSTGGQPQYLLKKIETLQHSVEFSVVEWSDITGGKYIVQRSKIKDILNSNFYSLGQQKTEIFNILSILKPEVIHFEEIPETFVSKEILDAIYNQSRSWKIVVTTHSSQTDFKNLTYLADKFVLVSEWSKSEFMSQIPEIDCEVWEYPTEYVDYDKSKHQLKLGFDPHIKHVLNVGLFTPGKNQKELVELARVCQVKKLPIEFHFVGNQAVNFQEYWLPIMQQLPSNCTVHGERSDVDDFYKASDVFYFPSLMELNPISVKEALSFRLPIFLKNLHTYSQDLISQSNLISNDVDINLQNICKILGI